jgi:hypothetical protein
MFSGKYGQWVAALGLVFTLSDCGSGENYTATTTPSTTSATLSANSKAGSALVPTSVVNASFLKVLDEAQGRNCATGGKALLLGTDQNGNGILDAGEVI